MSELLDLIEQCRKKQQEHERRIPVQLELLLEEDEDT
jgi:hypothetical protein